MNTKAKQMIYKISPNPALNFLKKRDTLLEYDIINFASIVFNIEKAYKLGKEFDEVEIDASTNSMQIIDYEHSEIHSGSAYAAHYENTCTNTGEQSVIAFNTPNTTKWIHIIAVCSSTSIVRCSIVENPSIDNDEGTDLTVWNRNRNSANTSGVTTIESSPEAGKVTSFDETQAAGANITETTQLDSIVFGAAGTGASGRGIGGSARGQLEWVLDQNNQYAFIMESLDASDNVHTIELFWYEHTDKN